MTVGRATVAAGLLALVLPAIGAAQGIGDAAAREKAKREKARAKTAGPARLITNEDLASGRPAGDKREGAGASGSGSATEAPAENAPADSASPSSSEDRQATLRPYLEAKSAAEARVSEIEARIRELGGKLNPMSTTFIYGATGSNSAAEEAEVRQQLTEVEAQLGEARKELAAASEAFDAARVGRAVPPPSEAH